MTGVGAQTKAWETPDPSPVQSNQKIRKLIKGYYRGI